MSMAATEFRTVYTVDELRTSRSYEEPLIANGVRWHGGFDADGQYHSPRTLHRSPAVEAWQAQLGREHIATAASDRGASSADASASAPDRRSPEPEQAPITAEATPAAMTASAIAERASKMFVPGAPNPTASGLDRRSTRLNSSHP